MFTRIKELRIERGWSQEDLAKRSNTTQAAIARYESELAEPKLSAVVAIARVYNVTLEYLLGLEDLPENADPLADDERDLVTRYRSANAQGRIAIQAVARAMSNNKTGLDVNIVAAD